MTCTRSAYTARARTRATRPSLGSPKTGAHHRAFFLTARERACAHSKSTSLAPVTPGCTAFLFPQACTFARPSRAHVPTHALGERCAGVRAARAEPRRASPPPRRRDACGSKVPPFFGWVTTLGLLLDAQSRTSRPSPHLAAGETLFRPASLWGKTSNTCRFAQNPEGFFLCTPTHTPVWPRGITRIPCARPIRLLGARLPAPCRAAGDLPGSRAPGHVRQPPWPQLA
jgi:hypothetical protein